MNKKEYSYSNKHGAAKRIAASEAYRLARNNIDFSIIGNGCKVITFTSPEPADGKTTTIINTAISFSKQVGKRVLIIDCDLRKPRVANCFGIKNVLGLTEYLCKDLSPDEIVCETKFQDLYVITSGEIPPNPAELLASRRMQQLIGIMNQQFDYILIDTPPENIMVDAITVAKYCDGIVGVVREKKTSSKNIDTMLATFDLADVKFLGFILNAVGSRNAHVKYYHSYKDYQNTK